MGSILGRFDVKIHTSRTYKIHMKLYIVVPRIVVPRQAPFKYNVVYMVVKHKAAESEPLLSGVFETSARFAKNKW